MIPIERIKGNVTLLSRPIPMEHKKEAIGKELMDDETKRQLISEV